MDNIEKARKYFIGRTYIIGGKEVQVMEILNQTNITGGESYDAIMGHACSHRDWKFHMVMVLKTSDHQGWRFYSKDDIIRWTCEYYFNLSVLYKYI